MQSFFNLSCSVLSCSVTFPTELNFGFVKGFPDGAKSHSVTTVETAALQALRERYQNSNHLNFMTKQKCFDGQHKTWLESLTFPTHVVWFSETDSTQSEKDITTLRLKSEDGMETFIMKMYFTETIGDLRHYLDVKRFEIRLSVFIISTTALFQNVERWLWSILRYHTL